MTRARLISPLLLLLSLGACEQLGIPDPAKDAAAKEAEGKAIGSACRHAGRALEDCYTLNPGGHKAAIFAGWREMNDYMAENKIDTVKPELPTLGAMPKSKAKAEEEAGAEEAAAESAPKSSRRRSSKAATSAH
ncbi:hypothetical protein [Uliginosibacterium aquaticum]|uniref:Lipoprotein n=1 Tax=Uliginosibacterium aquaticum TaxID=2731212 RepID=A0ABX2IB63_9RHOO|nr:hypothetical protein [Uliginosibacterium aquaticum]NSL53641.1 hypothetical protein [Uliginosibacterium aquaticum]